MFILVPFCQVFPSIMTYKISFLSHTCHRKHPYYCLISDVPNHIWWSVNCMKQLTVLFSQPSSYFLLHTFKCVPQYPVLKYTEPLWKCETVLHNAPSLCMLLYYWSRSICLKEKGSMETWSRLQTHNKASPKAQRQKAGASLVIHLLQKK